MYCMREEDRLLWYLYILHRSGRRMSTDIYLGLIDPRNGPFRRQRCHACERAAKECFAAFGPDCDSLPEREAVSRARVNVLPCNLWLGMCVLETDLIHS
jgi:hypothetical protein